MGRFRVGVRGRSFIGIHMNLVTYKICTNMYISKTSKRRSYEFVRISHQCWSSYLEIVISY